MLVQFFDHPGCAGTGAHVARVQLCAIVVGRAMGGSATLGYSVQVCF